MQRGGELRAGGAVLRAVVGLPAAGAAGGVGGHGGLENGLRLSNFGQLLKESAEQQVLADGSQRRR